MVRASPVPGSQPQQFFDRARDQARIVDEEAPLVGIGREEFDAAAEHAGRRVVAPATIVKANARIDSSPAGFGAAGFHQC